MKTTKLALASATCMISLGLLAPTAAHAAPAPSTESQPTVEPTVAAEQPASVPDPSSESQPEVAHAAPDPLTESQPEVESTVATDQTASVPDISAESQPTATHATLAPSAESQPEVEPPVAAVQSASTASLPIAAGDYWVSSYFGPRVPSSLGSGTFHDAIDLAADDGISIYAIADGVVTRVVEPSGATGAGIIVVEHGTHDGKVLEALYAHMWEPSKHVAVGDQVVAGQQIAEVGASGIANGPHLHLKAMLDGVDVDPLPVLEALGIDVLGGASYVRPHTAAPELATNMRSHGRLAVRASADFASDLVTVLAPNSSYTVRTGPGTNGFAEVVLADGATGWAWIGNIGSDYYALDTPPTVDEAQVGASERAAGTQWRMPDGATRYLRDLPSYAPGENDVLVLADSGHTLVATGRTFPGGWEEFTVNGVTGWLVSNVTMTVIEDEPTDPEQPVTPEEPSDPEEPVTPERPATPAEPTDPEQSTDSNGPVTPEGSIGSEEPEQPVISDKTPPKGAVTGDRLAMTGASGVSGALLGAGALVAAGAGLLARRRGSALAGSDARGD